jgi:hypothetical protein
VWTGARDWEEKAESAATAWYCVGEDGLDGNGGVPPGKRRLGGAGRGRAGHERGRQGRKTSRGGAVEWGMTRDGDRSLWGPEGIVSHAAVHTIDGIRRRATRRLGRIAAPGLRQAFSIYLCFVRAGPRILLPDAPERCEILVALAQGPSP